MKTDMTGAAVALATVLGAAAAGVAHRVTAVLPLAENHFGGASYRPGDVLTMWGGTTVEIANTDAEGRLVLADALAWADATLDPDVLIDVATLTGAATLGLGKQYAALYSGDDELADALVAAGDASGELAWHMPLVEEYEEAVSSQVADLRHVPVDKHIGGGSITAALFLRHFVGKRTWAHLDIAGPARCDVGQARGHRGCDGLRRPAPAALPRRPALSWHPHATRSRPDCTRGVRPVSGGSERAARGRRPTARCRTASGTGTACSGCRCRRTA